MLPRPTPPLDPHRGTDRRTPGRVLSVVLALAVLTGLPGLAGAPTAAAVTAPAAPTAVSLSVVAGPVRGGTPVDLSGPGVGATTTVWFGSVAVTAITHVSATRVRVTTPPHAAAVVNVRVTTPAGTSPLASRSTFAFEAVPTVTALSTRTSPTTGGAMVTLTGSGLYRASAVSFGAAPATGLTRVSSTQLRVTAPAHAAGAVDVRVTTPGGTSAPGTAARFTFVAPTPPRPTVTTPAVSALSPTSGTTRGGTSVTVTGQRFTGATKVSFGAAVVTRFTILSNTQLRVTAPAHAAGAVDVRVTTAHGTSPVAPAARFTFVAPTPPRPTVTTPAVSALSPTSGRTRGGTSVTVTGQRFTGATKVSFGAAVVTRFTILSNTQLRVTAPAHATGAVDVRVTTAHGTSPVAPAARFTFAAAPVVTSLSVPAGPVRGGTVVTIGGQGFTGATSVTFGSAVGTRLTILSSTQLRVTTPPRPAGVVNVHVTTRFGTSAPAAANAYAYEAVPTVSAITPPVGLATGGTLVTVTGSGFTRATAVLFGTTPATKLERVSATTLRATAPPHAGGTFDVRVTTPGGTSPVSARARILFGWPPAVSDLSVTAGPLRGGVVVTVTGSHLGNASQVQFGGVAASGLVRVSDTTLRVTAPAAPAGTVAVRVMTPIGTSPDTARATFTYVGVPTVTTLSTPAGPLAGGTVVTLTGTSLGLASTVDFGGTPGTALVRVSDTELRVTSPARPEGTVTLLVTTPGGVSAAGAAASFTYQPVPTVASVAPGLARTRGGDVVTVTGTGFDRVAAVTFGTDDATAVTRVSATQLQVTLPAHAEGDVDVRVTTPGGTSAVVPAGRFTFQDPPVIAAVSPSSGPLQGGTVITLSGTSFTAVSGVWVNGAPATSFTAVSATQLSVVVPTRRATGPVPIRVTTRAGDVVLQSGYTYVAGSTLQSGEVLLSGSVLRSPNGAYVGTMQADGNFVITTSAGVRRWATGTSGAGNRLFVRSDGQVMIMGADSSMRWSSGTNGWTGALVTLTNDGLLQARQGTTTVWDHRGYRYDRLLPGQVLRSGESLLATNQAWRLTMRTDGNLELASASGVRQWAAYTTGAGSTATMQGDGNFVVRTAGGVTQWSTKTSGAGSTVRVLGTPNVAVYSGASVLWAITGGPAPANWSCYSRATQDCIQRFGYYGQRAWNYPVDPWGNNCTNFSAYRLSRDGVKNPGNLGNATSWDTNARAKGFAVDQQPRVGDIAQWNSNHVAYVDWVSSDGSTIAISESGYGGTVLGSTYTSMSGRRIISRGSYSWPSNFIHFR